MTPKLCQHSIKSVCSHWNEVNTGVFSSLTGTYYLASLHKAFQDDDSSGVVDTEESKAILDVRESLFLSSHLASRCI